MNNEVGVSRDITGSIKAEIVGNADDINGPLFAINWFDTRLALIYHFYCLLLNVSSGLVPKCCSKVSASKRSAAIRR